MKKEAIISKDFILLFIFSVLVCTGMNMLNVIVPLYVTEDLGGSNATAGLMTTIYTIAACISRPVNGVLTDRLGRRRVMVCGIALFGVACWMGSAIPALVVLTLCRVLMGFGYSAATTANNTAATDVIPENRVAEGIGYFGMSQSVASAFGPALAAVVVGAFGNVLALRSDALIAAAALITALFIRYEGKEGHKAAKAQEKPKLVLIEKTALIPSLYQGLSLFLISCLMCFMTLYIVSRGLSASVAGSFFAASSIMIILIRLGCSRLMQRFGAVTFLVPGYAVLVLVCVLLPLASTAAALIGCGLLYGTAHGSIWMVLGSEAVRYAPPERRGAANATFYLAFDAAIGLGAAFWGIMTDWLGYTGCFRLVALGAILLAISAVPVFLSRGKRYSNQT